MRIKYHREADRKKLVVAAAEQLGERPVYAGAPTMNYIVEAYTVAATGPSPARTTANWSRRSGSRATGKP